MRVRLSLSEGTVADCTQAHSLIADMAAQYLLADRGYDTNAIVAEAGAWGMEPVIPPRSQRKEPRSCDRALYKLGHLETISKVQGNRIYNGNPRVTHVRHSRRSGNPEPVPTSRYVGQRRSGRHGTGLLAKRRGVLRILI